MRARIVGVAVALLAASACGVDPDVTRANVIEDLAQYGSVDEACVDGVLGKYSDDELAAIDREARRLQDPEDTRPTVEISKAFRDLYASLFGCVTTTT